MPGITGGWRKSERIGRATVLVALTVLIMGLSDCKSDTDGSSGGVINQIDIDNYLRGNSTPPVITYQPPDEVKEGDRLQGSLCVKDPDGNPVDLVEWFLSFFADDPSTGSHFNGMLNSDGCMSWFLDVTTLPAFMKTSDGEQVWDFARYDESGNLDEDFSG